MTDGGVQACDYDPATGTLVIGGHYERIGPFDGDYTDTPTPQNNYPGDHVPFQKLNSIDGQTGERLEWGADIDSLRGLDAVLVLEDEQPGQSRVVVGGSFSESDRVEYLDQDNDRIPEITGDGDPSPGVALFRFQTPREPGTGGVTADTGNNGTGLGAGGPVGPASNLALTGTATQSSTGNGRTADRTIDGNANTALAGNSCLLYTSDAADE